MGRSLYPFCVSSRFFVQLLTITASMRVGQVAAQMVGSVESGAVTPHEVKAQELQATVLQGDVDLFTGRYSASYPLGQVSTGGLSFALSLQYSPTIVGSTTPTLTEGVPYGNGWSPNIPTISVSTTTRHAYTAQESEGIALAAPDENDPVTWKYRGKGEGDGYWYAPMVNIPGEVSGRAVFQRFDRSDAVFVLNTFEKYVELRYFNGQWRAYLPDGRIFFFGKAEVSTRMPSNYRSTPYSVLDKYLMNDTLGRGARADALSAIVPMNTTLSWHCTEIADPLHFPGQSILFSYDRYGTFDMYKELYQPNYAQWLKYEFLGPGEMNSDSLLSFANPWSDMGAPETYARDLFLKSIAAYQPGGEVERLELAYETFSPAPGGLAPLDLITHPFDSSTDLDELYAGERICQLGGDGNAPFSGWKRFAHIKSDAVPYGAPDDVGPADPYLRVGSNDRYMKKLSANSELAFDHGFLESPRLGVAPGHRLFPGDTYEVRTKVQGAGPSGTGVGNIDINIVTAGPNDAHDISGNEGWLSEQLFQNGQKLTLFSTFDRAIKWNTNGASSSGAIATSNFFVMPEVPQVPAGTLHATPWDMNNGFNIQVGPANSDNNFSMGPREEHTDPHFAPMIFQEAPPQVVPQGWVPDQYLSAYGSYPHRINNFYFQTGTIQSQLGSPSKGLLSHHPVPHSFGVGLPWSFLVNPGNRVALGQSHLGRPWDADMFKFWWNDHSATAYGEDTRANIPTLFGPTAKLLEVEVWRYSKRPLLLATVRHYVRNGAMGDGAEEGQRLNAELRVEHECIRQPLYLRLPYFRDDTPVPSGFYKNVFAISAIRVVPVDPSVTGAVVTTIDPASAPATRFTYSDADDFNDPGYSPLPYDCTTDGGATKPDPLAFLWKGARLLSGIIDPLGGTTQVSYNDLRRRAYTERKNLTAGTYTVTWPDPVTTDPCACSYDFKNIAIALTPTVKEIRRSGETSSDVRVTSYGYEEKIYRPVRTALPFNYYDWVGPTTDPETGYQKVTVLGPENGAGVRDRTVYTFRGGMFYEHTSLPVDRDKLIAPIWPSETSQEAQGFLLFGKLARIQQYDHADRLLIEDEFSYTAVKAFDNAIERPNYNTRTFMRSCDYLDYEAGFVGERHEPNTFLSNNGDGRWRGDAFLEFKGAEFVDLDYARPGYTPHYDVTGSMPSIYLNSYFIRKDRETHREFDRTGCSKTDPLPPRPPYTGTFHRPTNHGGGGYTNTASNANEAQLRSKIAEAGVTGALPDLLAAGQLQESVLSDAIAAALPADGVALDTILLRQNALSNARLAQLAARTGTLAEAHVLEVLGMQPYLADPALIAIGRSALSRAQFKALLLKQVWLSSPVLDSLVTSDMLPADDLRPVLQAQPELPDHVLINAFTAPHWSTTFKTDVLGMVPELPATMVTALTQPQPGWDLNTARELLVHGKAYPSDTALLALLADPTLPDQWLVDVLQAAPRALGVSVRAAANGRTGVKEGMDGFDWNGLLTDCDGPCYATVLKVENITDYEYYEAQPNGITNALAYKRLFGFAPEHAPFQLKWNPSWFVFSTQKWSPQMPGAYNRDEYFYHQDLRNRYDRHWTVIDNDGDVTPSLVVYHSGDTDVASGLELLAIMQGTEEYIPPSIPPMDRMVQFGDRTDRPFQQRMLSKGPGDVAPFVTNTFYHFFQSWPEVPGDLEEEVTHTGTGPFPCMPPPPPPTTVNGWGDHHGGPPTTGTYAADPPNSVFGQGDPCASIPEGYALVQSRATGAYYHMPEPNAISITEEDEDWEVICINHYDAAENVNENGTPRYIQIAKFLKRAFQLHAVYQQVEPEVDGDYVHSPSRLFHEAVPLMQFAVAQGPDPSQPDVSYYAPLLPHVSLEQRTVIERGVFQQVVLERNARGLLTKYDFPRRTRRWHVFPDPCYNYTDEVMVHPLLPDAVTMGYGLNGPNVEVPQTTHYTYGQDNSVATITDPNGTVLSYAYDDYGRLHKAFRNSELLGVNTYANWHNTAANASDAFHTRAQQNYLESIQPLEAGSPAALRTRAYVDPLGRAYNTIAATMDIPNVDAPPATVPGLQSAGKAERDTWDRTTMAYKPFWYEPASPVPFAVTNALLAASPTAGHATSMEVDPRGRPLFAAKPGLANTAANPHRVKYRYQFLDAGAFACMVGLSAAEAHRLMPVDPEAYVWRMTEIEDEDGRITREFTDPIGRKVATQGLIDSGTDAVTLFFFNGRGLLADVRDPEKHRTRYRYDHLGWLVRKITVDGGETRYMYDKSGNVVLEQDADAALGEPVGEDPATTVPTYRRYTYDRFGRLVRQERVRLFHPLVDTELVIGTTLSSTPIDVLAYADRNLELDVDHPENWPVPEGLSLYDFRDRSSLDWLAAQQVFKVTNNGPELITKACKDLVGDPIIEKEWHYDHDRALESLFPVAGYMQTLPRRSVGRVASTRTFPHLPFAQLNALPNTWQTWITGRTAAHHAVQQDLYAYNTEGQLQWQLDQFNPNGISVVARGLLTRLDYARYDLRGNLRTLNVDVNADGLLDLQQAYTYDAWGRLAEIRAGFDQETGPLVASYDHRPEDGRLIRLVHYARCDDEATEYGPVDLIHYTYDLRDRLKEIAGRHYKESLFYDAGAPTWPTAQANWAGGIAATTDEYTLSGAANDPTTFQYATHKGYTYDGLGRLLMADAVQGDATGGVVEGTGPLFQVGDEALTYDRIGNIRSLRRWGFFNDASTVLQEGWDYTYATATSRLTGLTSAGWSADRHYTYNAAGDLLTDDARQHVHTIGRAHLPHTVRADGPLRTESYLYDMADRRIFKREIDGEFSTEKAAVVNSAEYYLRDAAGRELGIMDLLKGTWTWYFNGPQRVAHLTPPAHQQPAFLEGNINNADPLLLGASGPYNSLLQCVLGLGPVDQLSYPITIWEVTLADGSVVYLSWADYQALPPEQVLGATPIQLDSKREKITVLIEGVPTQVELEVAAADAQAGNGAGQYPFTYTKYTDLALPQLTYYELDHLGNTRVAYTPHVDCKTVPAPTEAMVLEHVVDYYPYGKVLRQYVNTREKFLSTQHERDKETELDYRESRLYDSDLGRFFSMDEHAEQYPQFSPYAYVLANPIIYVDPDGRSVECGCVNPPCGPKSNIAYGLGSITDIPQPTPLISPHDPRSSMAYGVGSITVVTGPAAVESTAALVTDALLTIGSSFARVAPAVVVVDFVIELSSSGDERALQMASRRTQLEKSIRTLQTRLSEHEEKLKNYKNDPDKYDHEGRLAGKDTATRQRIIDGRIRHLEQEIRTFRDNISKAMEELRTLNN